MVYLTFRIPGPDGARIPIRHYDPATKRELGLRLFSCSGCAIEWTKRSHLLGRVTFTVHPAS